MKSKLKINSKQEIKIKSDREIFQFIKEYFEPYYVLKEDNYENNSKDVIKNIDIVVVNDIKKIETCYISNLNKENLKIHYNQSGFIYYADKYTAIQYEDLLHIVIIQGNNIKIYLNNDDPQYKYIPMRIIRDIIYCLLYKYGFMEVHAASICYKDKGIMIIGEKGAGKTTLLFRLLNSEKAAFISNDKTFFSFKDGEILGYPLSINIYPNIIEHVPKMKNLFYDPNVHYQHKEWKEHSEGGKRTFSILDIQKYIKFSILKKSKAKIILLPQKDFGSYELIYMNPVNIIKENIRFSMFNIWLTFLFGSDIEFYKKNIVMEEDIKVIRVYRDCNIEDLLLFIDKI